MINYAMVVHNGMKHVAAWEIGEHNETIRQSLHEYGIGDEHWMKWVELMREIGDAHYREIGDAHYAEGLAMDNLKKMEAKVAKRGFSIMKFNSLFR